MLGQIHYRYLHVGTWAFKIEKLGDVLVVLENFKQTVLLILINVNSYCLRTMKLFF